MTTNMIRTGDGCRIAYRFDGSPVKPVLLLSNSLGTSMAMWDLQIPAFAHHFRILRYDPRGHGQSDIPVGAYSLDRLGRDVIELLDALQIERVTLCGLSMGGMIGQWLGVHAPDRVDRLVICNSSSYMGPPSSWDSRINLVKTGGMAALIDATLERWFTAGFCQDGSPSLAAVREQFLTTDPQGYIGCCAAIRDMDLRRTAMLIQLPTLIIAGRHDPATPLDHSEALQRAIGSARLVVLDTAHLSNVELPEEFAAQVLSFTETVQTTRT